MRNATRVISSLTFGYFDMNFFKYLTFVLCFSVCSVRADLTHEEQTIAAHIKASHDNGKTYKDIAKELGVSDPLVSKYASLQS